MQLRTVATLAFGLFLSLPKSVFAEERINNKGLTISRSYTVVRGDTLWDIATRFYGNGLRWKDIASWNHLANPRIIHADNKITLQSYEPTAEVNLISNSRFEEDNLGIVENWASVGNVDLNRWYVVQKTSYSGGELSVKRIKSDEGDHGHILKSIDFAICDSFCSAEAVQLVPARENITYSLSAEAKIVKGNGGSLYLDFLNSNHQRIDVKTKGGYLLGNWSRLSVTGTSPSETAYIRVILYSSNDSSGVILWDNVELTENQ